MIGHKIPPQVTGSINGLELEHVGSEYGCVIASIGLAGWTPDQDGDPRAVINAADEALYYAMATGRNKITAFSPSA
ncbi:diguanylate cyclase [Burkholderia diffusa]|nr:diguanylate cyclase [Burkholderia diffusa]